MNRDTDLRTTENPVLLGIASNGALARAAEMFPNVLDESERDTIVSGALDAIAHNMYILSLNTAPGHTAALIEHIDTQNAIVALLDY